MSIVATIFLQYHFYNTSTILRESIYWISCNLHGVNGILRRSTDDKFLQSTVLGLFRSKGEAGRSRIAESSRDHRSDVARATEHGPVAYLPVANWKTGRARRYRREGRDEAAATRLASGFEGDNTFGSAAMKGANSDVFGHYNKQGMPSRHGRDDA